MRWFTSLAFVLLALPFARADGLIYRLPDDGAWVRFDMSLKAKENRLDGTLKMASVGQVEEEGKKCRWIEFKLILKTPGKDRAIISKVLVPEKALQEGTTPAAAMIRGWVDDGRGPPIQLKDLNHPAAGSLPVFLSGPLKMGKKLDKTTVDAKALGKLECGGQSGTVSHKQGTENVETNVVNRLHARAPFGVVQSTMDSKITRGQVADVVILTLTLAEVGKGAKSEMPDQK